MGVTEAKERLGATASGSFVEDTINWYLELDGVLATEEHYAARLTICADCPSAGRVNVLGKDLAGCTECGCPFSTKPKVISYYHPLRLQTKIISCPLDKWAATDLKFQRP